MSSVNIVPIVTAIAVANSTRSHCVNKPLTMTEIVIMFVITLVIFLSVYFYTKG